MSINPNENKTKLNQLWNDLKFNLPEINFNDTETITSSDENVSTLAIGSLQNLDLDSIELVDKEENQDEVELVAENDKSTSPLHWLDCEKNFEKYLQKDADQEVYLSDASNEDDEAQSEKSSLKTLNSPRKLEENNNQLKSNEQAVQITKSIFETTNSKLSMGIFDQINIDELLDKVDESKYLNYTPSKLPTASRLVNDENVLMKLAQMSHSISKDEDLNSLDFRTGALKPTTTKSCGTSTDSASPFNLIEKELNKAYSLSEQLIKNDLKNFLKEHNIRDGNLVATRRIDLRPGQQTNNNINDNNNINNNKSNRPQLTEKQKAADMLMQRILNTKDDEKFFRNRSKGPLKFINDSDLSSSSSDSESDDAYDSKSLWIERYRRQKMNK